MLPALQPQRPKPFQQTPRPSYAHQQTRATHETPQSINSPTSQRPTLAQGHHNSQVPFRPRSQFEAMPPFGPGAPLLPPRNLYDSAVRHPVFFTEQLRKPPFPIPQAAGHGWSPVASGYIMEQRKVDLNSIPKTKL